MDRTRKLEGSTGKWRVVGVVLALAAVAGTAGSAQPASPPAYVWPKPTAAELRLVRGALDIHVHLDPDSFGPNSRQRPRGFDVIAMARRAKAVGMRGFVIKQHYDQSAQLAYVTRQVVPGIEVYGGVGQNFPVGGVNAAAVFHMAEVKGGFGRIVWLPTWDSENHVKHQAQAAGRAPNRPFISVVRNGELTPEVKAVIAAVAATRTRDSDGELVLATGHLGPEECLMVIREARSAGVKRIVVTHGFGDPVFMSIPQMQEAVRLGAMVEFVATYGLDAKPLFEPPVYADAIRQVGVDNVIISSDFGQEGRPAPPDALAMFAGLMQRQGFSEAELHRMLAINPVKLLGLPDK